MIQNLNFTAIDFETANEQQSSVCSLGIVIVRNGKIAERKYRLIKPPEFRFSWRNIQVHGIKPEDVENELEFYRYWNSLKEILTEQPVIAHNAGFDIGVLKAVLNTYQLENSDINYSCSLRISRRTWTDMYSYSLGNLGKQLGYTFNHHHALEDAEMSAKLIIDACKKTNSSSLDELHSKLQIVPGKLLWNKKHVSVKSKKISRKKKGSS